VDRIQPFQLVRLSASQASSDAASADTLRHSHVTNVCNKMRSWQNFDTCLLLQFRVFCLGSSQRRVLKCKVYDKALKLVRILIFDWGTAGWPKSKVNYVRIVKDIVTRMPHQLVTTLFDRISCQLGWDCFGWGLGTNRCTRAGANLWYLTGVLWLAAIPPVIYHEPYHVFVSVSFIFRFLLVSLVVRLHKIYDSR
jgi:hypothetical protein